MPEMDGLEATRQIVSRWPANERPRIVAMTADAMQGDREKCIEAGMDEYLTKPIRTPELVAAIERTSRRDGDSSPSESSGPAEPAVDRATMERLVESMGDAGFVAELLDTFSTDASGMLDGIDEAIDAGDGETVHRIAHTMKSNAATFGASSLSEACREMEIAARQGSLNGAATLTKAIRSEYERASHEFSILKAELTSR
jgi:HPt (histidine-containing phosphotransfer) domain-containing protein